MKLFEKIKLFFTRTKWTTIWINSGSATIHSLVFGRYKTTIYAKLQVSNKGKWRTIITDGDDVQYFDSDILFSKQPAARIALNKWLMTQNNP